MSQYYHIHQMQHIEKIEFPLHPWDANSQILPLKLINFLPLKLPYNKPIRMQIFHKFILWSIIHKLLLNFHCQILGLWLRLDDGDYSLLKIPKFDALHFAYKMLKISNIILRFLHLTTIIFLRLSRLFWLSRLSWLSTLRSLLLLFT